VLRGVCPRLTPSAAIRQKTGFGESSEMVDLSGINVAMQTPFDEAGGVDFGAWEELIEKYIDAGVSGLVLGAGTGQHPYLTEEECNKLYEIGSKRVGCRCNIICQTSALNVDEVIRRSRHAESIGADALMILPPYLEGPTDDDGQFAFYKEIDSHVGIDIIGYNIPQATGISVSPDLLKRLNGLPNFKYIKDSSGDLATLQAYLLAGGRVLNGSDPTTVFALMAGAQGAIWGAANYMPAESVLLAAHVRNGDHAAALELWSKMIPSLSQIWRRDYIPSVVFAANLRGFGTGNVRRPLRALDSDAQEALVRALEPLSS
jgi:4-hydroxy-tetrahydrodipicolinate synthase